MDIREGDFLVVDGAVYPIRSAAQWRLDAANSLSFGRLAEVPASTQRNPGLVDGKRGEPATHLSGLFCSPLDPVDPEIRRRMALETPHELLQTFVADEYGFIHLILEDLKR